MNDEMKYVVQEWKNAGLKKWRNTYDMIEKTYMCKTVEVFIQLAQTYFDPVMCPWNQKERPKRVLSITQCPPPPPNIPPICHWNSANMSGI